MIEIISASHNEETLQNNLLKSAITKHCPVIIQRDYTNVAKAYNEAKSKAAIQVYVHNDVFLPDNFEDSLYAAILNMNIIDPNWGCIGSCGVRVEQGMKKEYGYILDRGREWGSPNNLPQEVQTLDEVILITKGDLKFDEQFEQDFYGADLCLNYAAQGRKSYAAKLFLHHNSGRAIGGRTPSFYESEEKFYKKWTTRPLCTTCSFRWK